MIIKDTTADGNDERSTLHLVLRLKPTTEENDGYDAEDETRSQIIEKRSRRYSVEKLQKIAALGRDETYDEAAKALREMADLELGATDGIVDLARKEEQLGKKLEDAAREADANGNEGNAVALDLLAETLENAAQKTWDFGEKAVEAAGVAGFIADAAETWEGVKREFGEVFHDNHGAQPQTVTASSTLFGFGDYLARTTRAFQDAFSSEDMLRHLIEADSKEASDQETRDNAVVLDYRLEM